MFKIGDFSKLGQVSVRMLRHYDQLGLLNPDHIDKFTGYRYYTAQQLAHLNRIIFFKDLGFSLQQIKDLLSNNLATDQLRGMLMMKQVELEREVQDSHARFARVEARLQQIEREGKPPPYEVATKSADEMVIASVRQLVTKPQEMDYYCKQMYTTLYIGADQYFVDTLVSLAKLAGLLRIDRSGFAAIKFVGNDRDRHGGNDNCL